MEEEEEEEREKSKKEKEKKEKERWIRRRNCEGGRRRNLLERVSSEREHELNE